MMTLRKMGYVRHVACTAHVRNAYKILMGKNHSEAKPTCMNIIIIDLKYLLWCGQDSLTHDRAKKVAVAEYGIELKFSNRRGNYFP